MSHLMSAQLGKCGVNPALRNSRENREIRENRKIPVHSEEKDCARPIFIMEHRVD